MRARLGVGLWILAGLTWHVAAGQGLDPRAARLLAEGNAARAEAGVGPLHWDRALARAAQVHCERMAAEGPIAHQYAGEADVAGRAAAAGARFSLLEENVAVDSEAGGIHEAWMNSPGHRANLLNAKVDAVGIAVVAARGVYYAVADYARRVPELGPAEVEAVFAGRLREYGVVIEPDARTARGVCAAGQGGKWARLQPQPALLMHWQGEDPGQLPEQLVERLKSGRYRKAGVGACPAEAVPGGFTQFRLAVLLYE